MSTRRRNSSTLRTRLIAPGSLQFLEQEGCLQNQHKYYVYNYVCGHTRAHTERQNTHSKQVLVVISFSIINKVLSLSLNVLDNTDNKGSVTALFNVLRFSVS